MALVGCTQQAPPPAEPERPFVGVTVSLLVVDDPPLAQAIERLRGQWQAETGGTLAIEQAAETEFAQRLATSATPPDAIVYSPGLLGTLAEDKAIRPLPRSWLTGSANGGAQLAWNEIFELLKTREVTWGSEVYAVPLGTPVLVCFFREDLLAKLSLKPPRTWEEYQKVAEALTKQESHSAKTDESADAATSAWQGAAEPLAPGWAGLTLLARAACYARHANHYSTLFNMTTMEPLIASPPFVRALEELIAAQPSHGAVAHDLSPADVWRKLSTGECGLALSWPANPVDANPPAANTAVQAGNEIGCVELPGSAEVYNTTADEWERRPGGARSVPLLGMAGRVGSVTTGSAHADAAERLLAWLASRNWSEHASAASENATLFRPASGDAAQVWAKGLRTAEATQYAAAVAESLTATDSLVAPRIPGANEYLQTLDDAVRSALAGEATPQDALTAAAAKWREITNHHGLEKQRDAYGRSLGL